MLGTRVARGSTLVVLDGPLESLNAADAVFSFFTHTELKVSFHTNGSYSSFQPSEELSKCLSVLIFFIIANFQFKIMIAQYLTFVNISFVTIIEINIK
jgi:hypothetical protein